MRMDFRLLGPVECTAAGRAVAIGHPRQRCVLAVLLVEVNRSIHAEQLIDRVWGEQPPTNVRNVLSSYITRLRGVLKDAGADAEVTIARRSGGYGVSMDPNLVDMHRFRALVTQADTVDDPRAAALLGDALALWRGPAFTDMDSDWLLSLRETLAHERLQAQLRRNDIALRAGQHAALLAELHELVAEHPLDERVVMQFMLALYRSGRQADALTACAQAKSRLVRELGLDPGQELRDLEEQILRNDAVLTSAPKASPPRSVPRQLPAGAVDFTGRERELSELDGVLTGDGGPAVVISALDGTAGVGKTALAVHWAHRAKQRFPDGQLFVNLRGHSLGSPTDPGRVLAQFLRALGVPPEQVPLDPDEAAAMYRTALADRRALVVLDNAWGPEQVRPLLPGSPTCAVLITSRNQLSGLVARDGARQLTVGVLTDDAARELVTRIVGGSRVTVEPDAVSDLLRLCSHLPLALRIAAAKLANSPGQPIADLVTRLRRADRLDLLQMENDPEAVVRSAFHLSYTSLDTLARRLFRLLGVVPGPSFSAPVVAAMLDRPVADAARLLTALRAAHLIEGEDGRYWCHDLLRLFARERLADEETDDGRATVRARLHDHYLRSVTAAGDLLYPQMLRLPAATAPPTFADHDEALAWVDSERVNLLAVIANAADEGPRPTAWLLADHLRGYFWLRRCTAEWLAATDDALRAAESEHDRLAQASAWLGSATAHWTISSNTTAVEHYQHALRLAGEIGWIDGQAAILGNLASVYLELGELERAESAYVKALDLNTRHGYEAARGVSLGNLGNLYWELGALRRAEAHFTEALAVHDAAVPKANTLLNLGSVQHDLGDMTTALDTLRSALALCREIGDSADEAMTLEQIARVHLDTGRLHEALGHGHAALALAQQIGTRRIEAAAQTTLGAVHLGMGHTDEAAKHQQEALAIGRAMGDRRAVTEALTGLATTRLAVGDLPAALADTDEALAVSRQAGYGLLTARALTVRGEVQLRLGDRAAAGEAAGEALRGYVDAGDELGEARARDLLARVRST